MNPSPLRWLRRLIFGLSGLVLLGGFALACSFVYLAPSLPTSQSMHSKELAVPMRAYTSSGALICQIGEERRNPVSYEEIPDLVRHAVLAAEDDRFFEHHGLDWMGVLRAVIKNVISADAAGQGGSTITQQAARNMFLTLDKTARRKLSEVFVTYRMERDFTKEEILAVYLNVAVFGNRSRGIAAAAETYYNRHLDQLTVSQAATLVGLLPAPSNYNPIKNPRAAEVRRNYVLGRMTKLRYIDEATAATARNESVRTRGYAPLVDVEAPDVCEMVRQDIIKRFGPAAVNAGYKIITTIDGRLQAAADRALRVGLIEVDRRRGYRGRLGKVQLPPGATAADLDALLDKFDSIGILLPAVVTKVSEKSVQVHVRYGGEAKIDWEGLKWARPLNKAGAIGAFPQTAGNVVTVGDVVFVVAGKDGAAQLAQLPGPQSALIALNPDDGAVVSLVGGFDFHQNSYNRAWQAHRQPGSGFKPFLYSAALENGFTASSLILDAPVVTNCRKEDEECWHPENHGGGYSGLMRFRYALVHSINSVSIRILQTMRVTPAIEHAVKFGFSEEALPHNETLALGTLAASPWEMATAYATFANGGFKVDAYFISRIEDSSGKVVFEWKPKIACRECELAPAAPAPEVTEPATDESAPAAAPAPAPAAPKNPGEAVIAAAIAATPEPAPHTRDVDTPSWLHELALTQGGPGYLPADRLAPRVISPQNAWIMTSIMHDVIESGTAVRAKALKRDDLAGKTGTTNESRDTWFNGYTRQIVATVWVGNDNQDPLGATEEGSRTALPIWMMYMKEALTEVPSNRLKRPGGLVDLRVSTTTGELADQNDPKAMFDTFMFEHPPQVPENGETGKRGETLF